FVVLLSSIPSNDSIKNVAENIVKTLSKPVAVAHHQFNLGASIGIAIYPRDGRTFEELMRHADKAMYRVKKSGKNNYQFANC
ncbi:MAG: GGDEF domain-containing protein, partial [Pseudomonadota bacterium]